MKPMSRQNLGHPMMIVLRERTQDFTNLSLRYIKQRIFSLFVLVCLTAFLMAYSHMHPMVFITIGTNLGMIVINCVVAARCIEHTQASEIDDMVETDYSAAELNYEKVTSMTARINQGIGEMGSCYEMIRYEYVVEIISCIITCIAVYLTV